MTCCRHSLVSEATEDYVTRLEHRSHPSEEHQANAGSFDTIDDSLFGCDSCHSETDAGADYVRQQSMDSEGSCMTHHDEPGRNAPHDMAVLEALDDILLVCSEGARHGQGQVVEITVDSSAAEVVAPPMFAADEATDSAAGSKSEVKYRTASGKVVANFGEKKIARSIEDGEMRVMTFQVPDVTEPLTSGGTDEQGPPVRARR